MQKKYVSVNAEVDTDGVIRPLFSAGMTADSGR